jgi:hypothetical protein
VSELPPTTRTGDPDKDVRSSGDGADDVPGDEMHHAEGERVLANIGGFMDAWRERLNRRQGGRSSRRP